MVEKDKIKLAVIVVIGFSAICGIAVGTTYSLTQKKGNQRQDEKLELNAEKTQNFMIGKNGNKFRPKIERKQKVSKKIKPKITAFKLSNLISTTTTNTTSSSTTTTLIVTTTTLYNATTTAGTTTTTTSATTSSKSGRPVGSGNSVYKQTIKYKLYNITNS